MNTASTWKRLYQPVNRSTKIASPISIKVRESLTVR